MEFWETVESLRKEQNTSYRWLAKKMGVSETTVSTMRRNGTEPRATEAVRLATALGTTVEFLVTGEPDSYYKKYSTLKSALQTILHTF